MKRFIYITLLLTLGLAAAAQQVSFKALPPRGTIYEGDKFALSFRLENASANAPAPPRVDGCTFIYGPSTSSRSSYSVVNGQVTQSSSVDYSFTFRADKTGSFTVPAVSISVNGKQYTSAPFTITVHPDSRPAASRQGAQQGSTRQPPVDFTDPATQSASRSVGANDVFVRIILSKQRVYEQEALACTIKLYTKYQISSFFPTLQPSFDGFLIQELDNQPALNRQETLNGQQYMTAVLKKCILFPQHDGQLTITSGNYNITVVQYERVNMGIMTVSNPVEREIEVRSNQASVTVNPLPKPAPDGFSGAVGTFSVDSHLVGTGFRTGDAATLIYTISGTGNIKYLKEPQIDFPSEFELYEPQSDIDTRVDGNNVTGTMTINYTFVPQSVGQFKIGSDKFVYFNPATAAYVTLSTPPYSIKVAPGTAAAASSRAIESKNTDILHIKPLNQDSLAPDHRPVIYAWWYWLLYAAAALTLAALLYSNRRRMRMNADVAGTRQARAAKAARRHLRSAAAFLRKDDPEHFYEAVLQALWGFLSDKLSIPASQLSRDNVSDELLSYGASPLTVQQLITLLDECEMARYTPGAASGRMNEVFDQASAVINSIASVASSTSRKK